MAHNAQEKRLSRWRRIITARAIMAAAISSRESKAGGWLPGFDHRLSLPARAFDDDDLAEARLIARLRRLDADKARAALADKYQATAGQLVPAYRRIYALLARFAA